MHKKIIFIGISIIFAAIFLTGLMGQKTEDVNPPSPVADDPKQTTSYRNLQFTTVNPYYRFSAEIPESWHAVYVAGSQAVALLPSESSALDDALILIRTFHATSFLTLQTVQIHSREEATVAGHQAVRYDIEKKSGVPDFADQPDWRNFRHRVTDVRETTSKASRFFVFAVNPDLPDEDFNRVLRSLSFHADKTNFFHPLNRPDERISLKPFGIHITPQTSPVQPERFSGYHTAADYEIFPQELSSDVPFYAVCGGTLKQMRSASGYGGLAVQTCNLEGEDISIVYGHIHLQSVENKIGDYLLPGQRLGILADNNSAGTDFERKHLHLGIYKGAEPSIAGYVSGKNALTRWYDPQALLSPLPSGR